MLVDAIQANRDRCSEQGRLEASFEQSIRACLLDAHEVWFNVNNFSRAKTALIESDTGRATIVFTKGGKRLYRVDVPRKGSRWYGTLEKAIAYALSCV